MKKIDIKDVIKATKGTLIYGEEQGVIRHVSKDSREIFQDSLFVVFAGEKNDAHDFLEDVFLKGCSCALVFNKEKALAAAEKIEGKKPSVILVEDTQKALAELAKYYIREFKIKKIAVTGSTGKTSTKDMLYYICKEKYNTSRTIGNYNNEIGLPLTVLAMEEDTQVAIFEMGMSSLGEIHALADIVKPDIAVITNVGISHIENLGSQEKILQAKLEVVDYFNENNVLIINDDDILLTKRNIQGEFAVKTIGFDGHSDYIISSVEDKGADGISYMLEHDNEAERINLPVPAVHNAINASLAIAAAEAIGITVAEAKEGLSKIELTGGRLKVLVKNGIKLIDDTYNASPDSMKSGIKVLVGTKGVRKIAILGDMFELGENSQEYHREVGIFAGEQKIDLVVAIGENGRYIYQGAKSVLGEQGAMHFETKEEFLAVKDGIIRAGDVILVKGSRGMAMEKIAEKILY